MLTDVCDNSSFMAAMLFVKRIINIVFIVVPIILTLLFTIDLAKNVFSKDDQENQKNLKLGIKRIVYSLILLFVPLLVKTFMGMISGYSKVASCYDMATEEHVVELLAQEENRYREERSKKEEEREKDSEIVKKEQQEAKEDNEKAERDQQKYDSIDNAKSINGMEDVCTDCSASERIAQTAELLAWPLGSPAKKHKEKGGAPTAAYKNAINETITFPKNQLKYKYTKGVSCSVFTAAVVRASGYDKKFPYSVTGANSHAKNSKKWQEVSPSKAVRGDIFAYKNNNHILIYGGKKGSQYIWYQANLGRSSHNGDYGYAFYGKNPAKKTGCNVWHATGK